MKVLFFILGTIASIITPYLVWLISSFSLSYLLKLSGTSFVSMLFFGDPIIIGLIAAASTVVNIPLLYCVTKCRPVRWVTLPFYTFFAYCTFVLPWEALEEISFWGVISAIHFMLLFGVIYVAFLYGIFTTEKKKD